MGAHGCHAISFGRFRHSRMFVGIIIIIFIAALSISLDVPFEINPEELNIS